MELHLVWRLSPRTYADQVSPPGELPNGGKPLPVAVRAWVETIGWGVIAGGGYGLALVALIFAMTVRGGDVDQLAKAAGIAASVGVIALVWGGLLGLGYGIVAGFPMAVAMTALSATRSPGRSMSVRLLGAITAFTAVAVTGGGVLLGLDEAWGPAYGVAMLDQETSSTAFWFTVLAIAPGVIAGAIFAWRTPSIAFPGTPITRAGLAAPERRVTTVGQLPL